MPRYFFHVRDGISLTDKVGEELAGLDEAKLKAVELAGQLLSSKPDTFWQGEEWTLDVCDATDLILFTLQFTAMMSPALSGARRRKDGKH